MQVHAEDAFRICKANKNKLCTFKRVYNVLSETFSCKPGAFMPLDSSPSKLLYHVLIIYRIFMNTYLSRYNGIQTQRTFCIYCKAIQNNFFINRHFSHWTNLFLLHREERENSFDTMTVLCQNYRFAHSWFWYETEGVMSPLSLLLSLFFWSR